MALFAESIEGNSHTMLTIEPDVTIGFHLGERSSSMTLTSSMHSAMPKARMPTARTKGSKELTAAQEAPSSAVMKAGRAGVVWLVSVPKKNPDSTSES